MRPKLALLLLIVFCLIALVGILGAYAARFGDRRPSYDSSEWGVFGDYVGGCLNPLFALANIAVVVYIAFQIHDLEIKHDQAKKLDDDKAEMARRDAEKRRVTFTLYDRLILASETRPIWSSVAELRREWATGNRTILNYFLLGDDVDRPSEKTCSNGNTPHQNLSIIFHTWAAIQVYREQGFLDDTLAHALMGHLYRWNQNFFKEFVEQYKKQPEVRRSSPPPVWVEAIPKLDEFFS